MRSAGSGEVVRNQTAWFCHNESRRLFNEQDRRQSNSCGARGQTRFFAESALHRRVSETAGPSHPEAIRSKKIDDGYFDRDETAKI